MDGRVKRIGVRMYADNEIVVSVGEIVSRAAKRAGIPNEVRASSVCTCFVIGNYPKDDARSCAILKDTLSQITIQSRIENSQFLIGS